MTQRGCKYCLVPHTEGPYPIVRSENHNGEFECVKICAIAPILVKRHPELNYGGSCDDFVLDTPKRNQYIHEILIENGFSTS